MVSGAPGLPYLGLALLAHLSQVGKHTWTHAQHRCEEQVVAESQESLWAGGVWGTCE